MPRQFPKCVKIRFWEGDIITNHNFTSLGGWIARQPHRKITLILVIGLAAMCLFMLISSATINYAPVLEADAEVSQAFFDAHTPTWTHVFKALTTLGREVIWSLAALYAVYLAVNKQQHTLWVVLLAFGGGQLLNEILKAWFARPRPDFDWTKIPDSYGYPSGHSMIAIIGWGIYAYLYVRWQPDRRLRWAAVGGAAVIVILVGISRMYLTMHFLTDVLGGFVAGAIWLVTCIAVREVLARHTTPPTPT